MEYFTSKILYSSQKELYYRLELIQTLLLQIRGHTKDKAYQKRFVDSKNRQVI
jgi:hypothetical protein